MTTAEQQSGVDIARRWCESRGKQWELGTQLGVGGTAPVFEVSSPEGPQP